MSIPRPPNPLQIAQLNRDPKIRALIAKLAADPDAYLGSLTPETMAFIIAKEKEGRGERVSLPHLAEALARTAPIYSVERPRESIEAVSGVWSEPLMRDFWAGWSTPRGARGPAGKDPFAKAVMATQAMMGMSANMDDALTSLRNMPRLERVFADLEGRQGATWNPAGSYSGALRRARRLAPSCLSGGLFTNVAMIKEIARLSPGSGVGERLFIDGKLHPAWCQQLSAGAGKDKNLEVDAYLRRNTPHAGARAIAGRDGGRGRFARGYYLVILCDQVTGLPVAWVLQDAALDEAPALITLLELLFGLWEDCPAQMIAADSAWDEDWAVRHCAMNYGIDLIARLHDERTETRMLPAGRAGKGAFGLDPEGRIVCGHRKALPLSSFERPSRDGLRPGMPTPERSHRIRSNCAHGGGTACGRCSVAMAEDWSLLTTYPHYMEGRPDRHAMREAMLSRRNAIESLNNRLEAGYKQTGEGGDRVRIRDMDTHEALICLSFLSMTALALQTFRARAGADKPRARTLAEALSTRRAA
jgi:hypothetical protein